MESDDERFTGYWAVHRFGAADGEVMVIWGQAADEPPQIEDGFVYGILVGTERGVAISCSTISYMHEMTAPEVEAFLAVLEAERNNVAAQA